MLFKMKIGVGEAGGCYIQVLGVLVPCGVFQLAFSTEGGEESILQASFLLKQRRDTSLTL